MKKQRLSPLAINILTVSFPSQLQRLDKEIKATRYDYGTKEPEGIFNTVGYWSFYHLSKDVKAGTQFMMNIFEENNGLAKLAKEHNDLVGELRKTLDELFRAICTDEFVDQIKVAINSYNETAKDRVDRTPQSIAAEMVNETMQDWRRDTAEFLFYKTYGETVNRFFAKPEVQEKIKKRGMIESNLKEKAKVLKEELEKIQRKIANEYIL